MNVVNQLTHQIKAQTLEIKAVTSGLKEDVEQNTQKIDQFTTAVGTAEKEQQSNTQEKKERDLLIDWWAMLKLE